MLKKIFWVTLIVVLSSVAPLFSPQAWWGLSGVSLSVAVSASSVEEVEGEVGKIEVEKAASLSSQRQRRSSADSVDPNLSEHHAGESLHHHHHHHHHHLVELAAPLRQHFAHQHKNEFDAHGNHQNTDDDNPHHDDGDGDREFDERDILHVSSNMFDLLQLSASPAPSLSHSHSPSHSHSHSHSLQHHSASTVTVSLPAVTLSDFDKSFRSTLHHYLSSSSSASSSSNPRRSSATTPGRPSSSSSSSSAESFSVSPFLRALTSSVVASCNHHVDTAIYLAQRDALHFLSRANHAQQQLDQLRHNQRPNAAPHTPDKTLSSSSSVSSSSSSSSSSWSWLDEESVLLWSVVRRSKSALHGREVASQVSTWLAADGDSECPDTQSLMQRVTTHVVSHHAHLHTCHIFHDRGLSVGSRASVMAVYVERQSAVAKVLATQLQLCHCDLHSLTHSRIHSLHPPNTNTNTSSTSSLDSSSESNSKNGDANEKVEVEHSQSASLVAIQLRCKQLQLRLTDATRRCGVALAEWEWLQEMITDYQRVLTGRHCHLPNLAHIVFTTTHEQLSGKTCSFSWEPWSPSQCTQARAEEYPAAY